MQFRTHESSLRRPASSQLRIRLPRAMSASASAAVGDTVKRRAAEPIRGLALVIAVVLSGCTVAHVNYAGEDAARLRLSQSGMQLVKPRLLAVKADGTCGATTTIDSLYPPPTTKLQPGQTVPFPPPRTGTGPRAGMFDAPPPEHTDVAEIRLAPGRYGILQSGAWGYSSCTSVQTIALAPGEQYWLDFSMADAMCRTRLQKVVTQGTTARWTPAPIEVKSVVDCKRG